MATWNEQRQRRVIGEQAGPLQDEVMQGFNDQGFGGALAVQEGRVVGGNVGSRMPEDNIPRNRARVFFGGNQTDPYQGMSPAGRASAMSGDIITKNAMQNVQGPYRDEHERRTAAMRHAAEPMRRFLDPSGSLVSANELTDKMRPAGMTNEDWAKRQDVERGERNKEKDFERQLKIIQATPMAFGNQGQGVVNGRYVEPTPAQTVTKLSPYETALVGDRMHTAPAPSREILNDGQTLVQGSAIQDTVSNRGPVESEWGWNPPGTAVVDKRTGEVRPQPDLQQKAEELGLKDGQQVMMGDRSYFWSSKFGTFLDDTGAPVYQPQQNNAMSLNDSLMMSYLNEKGIGVQPQAAPAQAPRKPLASAAASDPNNPASKWKVN